MISLFSDDGVLLATLGHDLQHILGQFAAEWEGAGMRISISKSEAMILDRKKVACQRGQPLPQVEGFKNLGVLFTSDGRMEHEIDWWIGAVMLSVAVKKEPS